MDKYKKITDRHFIRVVYDEANTILYRLVAGTDVILKGFDGYDFFAHADKEEDIYRWTVTEGVTGLAISKYCKNLKDATALAHDNLSCKLNLLGINLQEWIYMRVLEYGFSPRYDYKVYNKKVK